jgi:predicted glycoside hydrolase/deacetylase ChbG (UPF0249 family)
MSSPSNVNSQWATFSHDDVTQDALSGCSGMLIVNADDWGLDKATTDCILDCASRRAVSSASAMVFMQDSERAAELALQHNVDTGLHLNLSSAFTGGNVFAELREHQRQVIRYLRGSKVSRAIHNPFLLSSFEYVVRAQLDEYERLYGVPARRVDGHHHMHLCANVQRQKLLPSGVVVRRNFSFAPGEKSVVNRLYRARQDRALARRHLLTDYFFSLCPIEKPGRLASIYALARHGVVEVETHPVNSNEYRYLTAAQSGGFPLDVAVAPSYTIAHI